MRIPIKGGPVHGGKAPLFMVAQVPFQQGETEEINRPSIPLMDDGGNAQVLSRNLKELGVWENMTAGGAVCLELGCGSGYMLETLYREGRGIYCGVEPIGSEWDRSYQRVEAVSLRQGNRVIGSVQHKAVENARWSPGAFDVIYSYHVFEHLENPMVMLDRARLWLKPGGRLVIVCPNVEGAIPRQDLARWRMSLPSHRWLPGVSTVRHALDDRGFHVDKLFTYGGYPTPRRAWQSAANKVFKWMGLGDVMALVAHVKGGT